MTLRTHMATGILAAVLLLGPAPATHAQDAMRLDTMFRESLSQGGDPQGRRQGERRSAEERRHDEGRNVHRPEEEGRRTQARPEEAR